MWISSHFSPILNPCANAFSVIKSRIDGEQIVAQDDMLAKIDAVVTNIAPDNCVGFKRHKRSTFALCVCTFKKEGIEFLFAFFHGGCVQQKEVLRFLNR